MLPWVRATFAVTAMLAGCSTVSVNAAALTGTWGAPQVQLTLTEAGGTLQRECDVTTIDGPVRPDKAGHFTVSGHRERYKPGPQLADVPPATDALTLTGHIDSTTMALTIAMAGQPNEAFKLEAGRRVKLIRCL